MGQATGPVTLPGGGGAPYCRRNCTGGGGGSVFYWVCKYILIGPWLRLLFRPQVQADIH